MSPDDVAERPGLEDEALHQSDGGRRAPDDRSTGSGQRVRRASSWIVLVVACILAVTSVLVVFVRNEALDTDTYVATVQPLASDPALQSAVADAVTTRLLAGTNLEQQVAQALPASAGFLATPISVGLKTVVEQTALQFVESDAFRSLWTALNRGAHRQLVALLTGAATGPVSTDRGQVRLDLGKVVDQVRGLLDANGITVFDGEGSGGSPQFVLFQSTHLERLQGLIRTLDRLALLLPIVTLVLFAFGVWLNVDRRRGLVRAAVGLSIAMAGLVAAFAVGRHYYLAAMSGVTPHRAAAAAYDIVARVPLDTVRTILGVSVVAALVGMAVGNRSIRTRASEVWPPQWWKGERLRRVTSTYAPHIALALFGIGMFVIVIWNSVAVGLPMVVVAGLIALVDRRRRPAPGPGPGPRTRVRQYRVRPGSQRGNSTMRQTGNDASGPAGDIDARAIWHRIEPLHAVTHFAPECRAAAKAAGLPSFWMGYFAARSAPLGPVGPAVVQATFFNFHASMVARSIPDAWSLVEPADVLRMRRAAAAEALKLRIPSIAEVAVTVGPILDRVVAEADGSGRALFSGNRQLGRPGDPVEALWQACTSLREHRGDGHVAMLTTSGLDGCEALVLFAASEGIDREVLRQNRGWSEDDWAAASDRLTARGLLGVGGITAAGRGLHRTIEEGTDRLAAPPYRILDPDEVQRLTDRLDSAVEALLGSGVIPFPNPIGLPPPEGRG